jgi:hypothetical protein
MISQLVNHAVILVGIFIGISLAYAGLSYLWNRKYVPSRLAKGKLVKPLGKIVSEVQTYAFKEDDRSLLKKGSPKVKGIFAVKRLHIYLFILGAVGFILTGNYLFLLVFPLSFAVGFSRALPVLKERNQVLERIFAIAGASINFSNGARGKNAVPPAYWNHLTVEEWTFNEEGETREYIPKKMILSFPTGKGPDLNAQRTFEKTFKANVSDLNDWHVEWELTKDRAVFNRVANLPTQLDYPGSEDSSWSRFPVGLSTAGVASFDVSTFPHCLVGGPSGTGKSVLQRNIVFHTIQHNYRWRFLGIDLKRVELTPYNRYKKTVMGIATEVDQGLEVLKYVNNEMMDRYKMMEEQGENNLMDLDDPPYCILLMIDEATMFLGASGSKTEEGKAEDAMKAEASDLVGKILRLGRAAGIHMVVAMQRPDATVLRGEFKANMDVRLAAGRMDSTPSSMILDSGEAVNLPGIKGRGLIRVGGSLDTFQGYFAKPDWIDDFILAHPEVEPSTVSPGGHLHEKYQATQRLKGSEAPLEEQPLSMDKPVSSEPNEQALSMDKTVSPVAQLEKTFPEPDFMNEPEPATAGQQNLMEALQKKPVDNTLDIGEKTIPTFFTGSASPQQDTAATPSEVDLQLSEGDFILDDFDDSIPEEESAVTPASQVPTPNVTTIPSPFGAKPTRPGVQRPAKAPAAPVGDSEASKPRSLPARPGSFPARPAATQKAPEQGSEQPVIQEKVEEPKAAPKRPVSPNKAPIVTKPSNGQRISNPFG